MKRLKVWLPAYVVVLTVVVGTPLAYVLFVPPSLDRKAGIGLRTLAFRWEESPVERAAELVAAGDVERAEERLEKYLTSRSDVGPSTLPTNSVCEALSLLSSLYESQGRRNRCLRARLRLVDLSPNDYYYAFLLGKAYEDDGNPAKALEHYRRSFRLQPGHPALQQRYFSLLGELARSDELVAAYDYYLRLEHRNPPLINVRYSPAPSEPERKFLELMRLPPMAPNVENVDVVLGRETSAVIPLGPARDLMARQRDVLLWGTIYNMADELDWESVEILGAEGERRVPPERRTLERDGERLEYDYSIHLPGTLGTPTGLRVTFRRTSRDDATLRPIVARAYRDRARALPAEWSEEAERARP